MRYVNGRPPSNLSGASGPERLDSIGRAEPYPIGEVGISARFAFSGGMRLACLVAGRPGVSGSPP